MSSLARWSRIGASVRRGDDLCARSSRVAPRHLPLPAQRRSRVADELWDDRAENDLAKVTKSLQDWFDSSMDRVAGRYKRTTHFWLLGIGLVMAAAFNINALRTSGMDIAVNYAMELWDGTLAASFNANYVDELTINSPGSPINDYAGVLGAGGASQASGSPKWKGLMSVNYKTGPYSFTTQVRWYGSAILNNAWNTGNLATTARPCWGERALAHGFASPRHRGFALSGISVVPILLKP